MLRRSIIALALCGLPAQLSASITYSNLSLVFPGDFKGLVAASDTFLATTFVTTGGGDLSTITQELAGTPSPAGITAGLYTSILGAPGALLESWSLTIPDAVPSPPPLSILTSPSHPSLSPGTQCWFVLTQTGPMEVGRWVNDEDVLLGGAWAGASLSSLVAGPLNFPAPAIELTSTSPVPEPTSAFLLVAGIVFAFVMRRRLRFSRATICLTALAFCALQVSAQNVNTPVPPGGLGNSVAKFSGPTTIVNSILTDNGSTVSITGPQFGYGSAPPLFQVTGTFGPAINASAPSYVAVTGITTNGRGLVGNSTAANGIGVFGADSSTAKYAIGVIGSTNNGIAVEGFANNYGWGAAIDAPYGGVGLVVGSQGITPSDFHGNVAVYGTLTKSGGSFRIDHPLDPANQYLSHSFVESPDMMNIYNGNIQTDAHGVAVVTLPEWFEALNCDFRYQLTAIGQPAQAWVATEISGDRFVIHADKPFVKVSWQVTGIRQDAWANAHRIPVEEAKPDNERGFYLHPELHGQSEEKGIIWARYPEKMRSLKEHAQAAGPQ